MRPRLLLVLAVLAVLGLVATAVGGRRYRGPRHPRSAGSTDGSGGNRSAAAERPGHALRRPRRLVHGRAADPVDARRAVGCLRSTRNYPAQLAQLLPSTTGSTSAVRAPTTGDITGSQELFGPTLPPQLDAVTADTDLVTIGIGGNDDRVFTQLVSGSQPAGLIASVGAPAHGWPTSWPQVQAPSLPTPSWRWSATHA